jgi:hypothetical protein
MAKFLTIVKLNDAPLIQTTFEAESAQEVRNTLTQLLAPITESEAAVAAAAPATPPKRRGRPPKSGVVGVITPAGAAKVEEPVPTAEPGVFKAMEPVAGPIPTLAELSDAIRAYARQPGVGVPGVTALIREFKTDAGEPAQQVKAIAQSEYPALAAKLKTLLVVS